eukprot:NODE_5120_length_1064_cov_41.539851_g4564_i0.p1 GENE.NODE_5120_length_1064_cov_41.539851_g4564_i0~~NODE_5120_length_1064_cov_41.539851_g4564_i0.p1  ORF type:complete len:202 (+),score=13.66 NODE_5120_length_1064_cov_41.539851_g4564_i0:60-665(+)
MCAHLYGKWVFHHRSSCYCEPILWKIGRIQIWENNANTKRDRRQSIPGYMRYTQPALIPMDSVSYDALLKELNVNFPPRVSACGEIRLVPRTNRLSVIGNNQGESRGSIRRVSFRDEAPVQTEDIMLNLGITTYQLSNSLAVLSHRRALSHLMNQELSESMENLLGITMSRRMTTQQELYNTTDDLMPWINYTRNISDLTP